MKKFRFFAVLGSILCALCIFTACKTNELDAPVGLTVDEDFVLTWDEVEDARRYKVEIKNVSTGKSIEKRASKTEYELSSLAEGDYEIRVMALAGNTEKEDSQWSQTLYYDKGYVSGVVYSLINNSEYQVIRAGTANGDVIVEAEYHDKPITSIADNAFKSSGRIEYVVLGPNIHTIGNNAFYNCSKLKTVELPNTITSFGESVFGRCRSLLEVNIPLLITEIPNYTFDSCKALEEIKLHENITKIGDSAFSGCSNLKSIEIPDEVTTIGLSAFANNSSLQSATIGSGVTTIGEYAFYACKMLDSMTFAQGSDLVYVGPYAMAQCTALETLNLPTGVKTLDDCAFMDSSLLLNVSIPTSVSRVGESAFYGTKMYKNAVDAGDTFIYADSWLIGCTTQQKEALTSITIETLKEGIIGVADGVFRSAPNLTTIVLPDSIRYIGNYAFYENPNLLKIETLPNSVVSIGEYAFSNCESLYRIILGNGLKTIGRYAFYGCKSLDDVGYEGESRLIPSTVETIGTYAFKDTLLWTKIKSGVVYAGDWVVGYRGANLGSIKLNDNTRGVADYAFYGCNSLMFVNGLSNVNFIGEAAFGYCENLRTVTLKRNITKISDYAFYNCSLLENVNLPARLTEVGNYAFYKCRSLSEIDFSDTDLEKIGTKAFYDCPSLKNIKFNNDVETIGDYAFYKCEKLESLVLPASLHTLSERSFAKCVSLKTLIIETDGDTILKPTVTIGKYAFQGCQSLMKIEIPDTVKTIDDYAFYKCINVRIVTLGNNVEKIGDYAFYGCFLPTELILPKNVQLVGSYAFKGWENLTSLMIDGGIPTIKDQAFFGCKKMTIYTSAKNEESVKWQSRWNSASRPVIWNCTFSEDNTKVESVVVGEIKYYNSLNSDEETQNQIRSPQCNGKNFAGWATEQGGPVVYTAKQIVDVEKGTILYAVWVDEQD